MDLYGYKFIKIINKKSTKINHIKKNLFNLINLIE